MLTRDNYQGSLILALKEPIEKLNYFLSVEGSREIYLLGLCLNALGLKLTVKVKN